MTGNFFAFYSLIALISVTEALKGLLPEGFTEGQLKQSTELAFVNKETGKPFVVVRKAMKRALNDAGVTRLIRFHDIYHIPQEVIWR